MISAKKLLKEYLDQIDLFDDITQEDSIKQLCFGLKKVLEGLRGKMSRLHRMQHVGSHFTYRVSSLTHSRQHELGQSRALFNHGGI